MYDEPLAIGEVNGIAVARVLEAIRGVDAEIRFCQASSSEIFANASESPQSEATPVSPRSPYGAAKAYADFMVQIYRERHGLFACSAILFNHESPRRSTAFVTRRSPTNWPASGGACGGNQAGKPIGPTGLGFAGDHVRAMWLMLQQPSPEISSSPPARLIPSRVLRMCLHAVGMDYREYVKEDTDAYRRAETIQLVGKVPRRIGCSAGT